MRLRGLIALLLMAGRRRLQCSNINKTKPIQRWRTMLKCYIIALMYCIFLFDRHLYVHQSQLYMRG